MTKPLDEGLLTANRISELEEFPVVGRFDTAHLCAIHSRIFQDLPHHHPGEFRQDAPAWVKSRELESGAFYTVPYAPRRDVQHGLHRVLSAIHGAQAFRGLSLDSFAMRMAQVYGDLDYLHPFREGNSRILRTFTRQLAREAGFTLDWSPSKADGVARDRLYRARDAAVIQRAFPGLDEQRAMTTDDRLEYESYWVLQKLQESPALNIIIREYTTYSSASENVTMAASHDEPEDKYESKSESPRFRRCGMPPTFPKRSAFPVMAPNFEGIDTTTAVPTSFGHLITSYGHFSDRAFSFDIDPLDARVLRHSAVVPIMRRYCSTRSGARCGFSGRREIIQRDVYDPRYGYPSNGRSGGTIRLRGAES